MFQESVECNEEKAWKRERFAGPYHFTKGLGEDGETVIASGMPNGRASATTASRSGSPSSTPIRTGGPVES